VLVGGGGANLLTGSCVLMTWTFPKDLFPPLFWGTVFLTLGAIVLPLLATRLFNRFGFRQGLLGIALGTLVPGILVVLLPAMVQPELARGDHRVFDSAVAWISGVMVFFYIFLLVLLASSANLYLNQAGHRPALASALIGCFWLAFLVSRIACGAIFSQIDLIPKDPEPWIIMLLALAVAIDLGNMAGSDNSRGAGVGLLIAGACLAPVLPTALSLMYRLFPAERGMATGVVWASGILGWLVARGFSDSGAPSRPDRNLLRAPLVLALLLAIAALILVLILPLER
jgi:hypothetical protein